MSFVIFGALLTVRPKGQTQEARDLSSFRSGNACRGHPFVSPVQGAAVVLIRSGRLVLWRGATHHLHFPTCNAGGRRIDGEVGHPSPTRVAVHQRFPLCFLILARFALSSCVN